MKLKRKVFLIVSILWLLLSACRYTSSRAEKEFISAAGLTGVTDINKSIVISMWREREYNTYLIGDQILGRFTNTSENNIVYQFCDNQTVYTYDAENEKWIQLIIEGCCVPAEITLEPRGSDTPNVDFFLITPEIPPRTTPIAIRVLIKGMKIDKIGDQNTPVAAWFNIILRPKKER